MSRGRNTFYALSLWLACGGLFSARPALAQDSTQNEIEINTSVLQELDPSRAQSATKSPPVILKPPPGMEEDQPQTASAPPAPDIPAAAPKPLTSPDAVAPEQMPPAQNAAVEAPPVAAVAAIPPRVPVYNTDNDTAPKPLPAPAPVKISNNIKPSKLPPRPQHKPILEGQAVSFPIVTKEHSDSPDPSLPQSAAAPKAAQNAVPPQPVPISGDVTAALSQQLGPTDGDKTAVKQKQADASPASLPVAPMLPVPVSPASSHAASPAPQSAAKTPAPHRIEAVKVSQSAFFTKKTVRMPKIVKATHLDIPDQRSPGVPVMPAMPPVRVTSDNLMNNMLAMDRSQVMAGVEDAVKHTVPHGAPKEKSAATHPGGIMKIQAGQLRPETSPGMMTIEATNSHGAKQPVKPGGKAEDKTVDKLADKSADKPVVQPDKKQARIAEQTDPAVLAAVNPAANSPADNPAALEPPKNTSPDAEHIASIQVPRMPPDDDYNAADYISIIYSQSQIGLDNSLQMQIKQKILPQLQRNPKSHLQIQAFASEEGKESHNSRQRSLARALAVREYMLGLGVEADRIDIHAMGMQTDRDPLDRIDFVFPTDDQPNKT